MLKSVIQKNGSFYTVQSADTEYMLMKAMSKRLQWNYCNESFVVYHRDVARTEKAIFQKFTS